MPYVNFKDYAKIPTTDTLSDDQIIFNRKNVQYIMNYDYNAEKGNDINLILQSENGNKSLYSINRSSKVYGCTFNPDTGVYTRLADAKGLRFEPSTTTYPGVDDFINKSPFNIRECLTDYNEKDNCRELIVYKDKDPELYNSLRNSKDCMIEFPLFYFKRPDKDTIYISDYLLPDFRPSPMHYRDGKLYKAIRISKYKINQNGSSTYGATVWVNVPITTYRDKLHSKKLYTFDAACYYSLAMLMFVKYANWDVQNFISLGYVGTYTNNYAPTPTVGFTDSILSMDGRTNENVANNLQHTLSFGIEDYYHNRVVPLDGIFRANTDKIVYHNSLSQPDFSAGLTDDLDPVWKIVETPIAVGGSGNTFHGYMTEMMFDNEFPELLLPTKGVFVADSAVPSMCNSSSGTNKYGTGIIINKSLVQCMIQGAMHYGRGYMGGILSINSNYGYAGNPINYANTNFGALSFEMVE